MNKITKEEALKLNNQKGTVVYNGAIKTGLVTCNETKNKYNVKGCSNKLFDIKDIFTFFEVYDRLYPKSSPLDSEVEEIFLEVGDLGLDEVSTDNNIYLVHETKVFKKLETTIRQSLQDKDRQFEKCFKISYSRKNEVRKLTSQLNQVREVVKKSRYKKAQNIISELPFIDDKDLKYVISPAYSLQEIKQILGDDTNE